MTYYLYHIPGKKIGITKDLKKRVEDQQGYDKDEYDIIMQTDDIAKISEYELFLQELYGYRVDEVPYNKLKFNKMKINVTEATTTFPCPLNKLKGQLMDNIGMKWETEHGELNITPNTIKWIMKNAKVSMYNSERSYIYNKAFARYYDNNDAYDQYNGKTRYGGLQNDNKVCGEPQYALRDCGNCDCDEYQSHDPEEYGMPECCNYDDHCTTPKGSKYTCSTPKVSKHDCVNSGGFNEFDLIRMWANQRGIYEHGDTKTQALKLMEEAGEICRAVLKEDHDEVVDGIGDCVVVLTNLAELQGVSIEKCINVAYNVISQRSGKMVNGTFKKD
jgi:NTP pyrophosphatase (non-canonical NTP hydrolase)